MLTREEEWACGGVGEWETLTREMGRGELNEFQCPDHAHTKSPRKCTLRLAQGRRKGTEVMGGWGNLLIGQFVDWGWLLELQTMAHGAFLAAKRLWTAQRQLRFSFSCRTTLIYNQQLLPMTNDVPIATRSRIGINDLMTWPSGHRPPSKELTSRPQGGTIGIRRA
jgi:hypothetical protein